MNLDGREYVVITRDPVKIRGKPLWETKYSAVTRTQGGELEFSGNLTSNVYPSQQELANRVRREIVREIDLIRREDRSKPSKLEK